MILVTGANGHLGHHVVEQLIAKKQQVVAGVRSPEKAQALAAKGAELRWLDYNKPESFEGALKGVDRVLLISGNEFGKRVEQHSALIAAAKKAGVKLLVYTSGPNAADSSMMLMQEHKGTEKALVASGVPYVILRNGWYIENYTQQLPTTLKLKSMFGAANDGKVSLAPRADYAAAAVAVLTGSGHENKTYTLGGESLTLAQLAEKISRWAGFPITYVNLSEADFAAALKQAGLPEGLAAVFADVDAHLAKGALEVKTGDLERLLGRKPISVEAFLSTLPKP